jgi:hypothetical protein
VDFRVAIVAGAVRDLARAERVAELITVLGIVGDTGAFVGDRQQYQHAALCRQKVRLQRSWLGRGLPAVRVDPHGRAVRHDAFERGQGEHALLERALVELDVERPPVERVDRVEPRGHEGLVIAVQLLEVLWP